MVKYRILTRDEICFILQKNELPYDGIYVIIESDIYKNFIISFSDINNRGNLKFKTKIELCPTSFTDDDITENETYIKTLCKSIIQDIIKEKIQKEIYNDNKKRIDNPKKSTVKRRVRKSGDSTSKTRIFSREWRKGIIQGIRNIFWKI